MRRILVIIHVILLFILLAKPVYAGPLDIIGKDEMEQAIPEQAQNYLDENSISLEDTAGIMSITPDSIFSGLFDMVKDEVTAPLKLLMAICAVIMLCALLEGFKESNENSQLAQTFNLVGVVVAAGIVAVQISDCIYSACQTLKLASTFLLSYIPVFTGVIAVSGNITTASIYNVTLFSVAQFMAQFAANTLVPLIGGFLALSIVAAINPTLNLVGIAKGIKTLLTWIIGLMMTVYVGLLTLQGFVGAAADSVTLKAAKFAVSGLLPIVGSAVAEAMNTLHGSLGLLKAGVGTFGIIVGISTMLPTIINVLMVKLAISGAAMVGNLFGIKRISDMLVSASAALTIILALLASMCVILVISTALILAMGMGLG